MRTATLATHNRLVGLAEAAQDLECGLTIIAIVLVERHMSLLV
jgi:hypothetical protein